MQIDLKEFHSWTKTKSGEYHYMDIFNCPLAQFLKEKTGRQVSVGGFRWRFADESEYHLIPEELCDSYIFTDHGSFTGTFPALTRRLEALL